MEKVTFFDPETGAPEEFAVEEETTLSGTHYLLVTDDKQAYIMKEVATEGEESVYVIVEDDTEFDALARVFEELTDEDTDLVY